MALKFYNTLTRSLDEFKPVTNGIAKMYTCGPTVYNFAHIGNFRAYMFEDLLRRTLKYCGYEVIQVMNLTDVDDKTIRDSQANNKELNEFTLTYKNAFFEDLKILNIEPAEVYPAATDHIPEMIELIQTLVDKNFAYIADDQCVYFSIEKFPDYGKLAKINFEGQRSGVRIANDEYAKDNVADFALWKAWSKADGNVKWQSPWGVGRPGWHIECSAMAMKYLGKTFDIHTGGVDNMFPHHEDEIAQSECANGQKYVNYWLHCAHLIINGEKMSKSSGNFFTLRQLLEKGFSGREIRWVLLGTHYRQQLNFTFDGISAAKAALGRIDELVSKLKKVSNLGNQSEIISDIVEQMTLGFKAGIENDLTLSTALASVFEFVREINKSLTTITKEDAIVILDALRDVDKVIGCFNIDQEASLIPENVIALAEERRIARSEKNWAQSDILRDKIQQLGFIVKDTPHGFELNSIS
ncbi:MAG: cysteine--tRNA ligase [Lentisphaeria bacterium]